MTLAGSAVLAIWNGIEPEAEEEFVAWHVREHIPERVGLPGFLRGRRYVATQGFPKYFNFYETETVATLSSPVYLARLDSPSPWTKAVVAHFKDTSRTICAVRASLGHGDGAAIVAIRLSTSLSSQAFTEALIREIGVDAMETPGIVGFHVLQGDSAASNQKTAEKKLRDKADEVADWIFLLEAVDIETIERLENRMSLTERLVVCGAEQAMQKGTYVLQYALSQSQLSPNPIN
jgi:hypothetical protein